MNREIIEQFAAAINQQDLVKLIELMAEDFSFVDTYGGIENKGGNEARMAGIF
ncbi:nuclear transport factor 2 family protein [Enterococcus hulanensis]|uniref:nuclear transport factor 2 family protein n=1 Tax=Enterococcus hulanensis TaxID=2559929 RepID=UPI002016EF25|nr:nuclear transport factor 2 family protein [Enterococcus hulanensis]